MRRAFTLIEMLIVVALIATLMTVVFRLSSTSSEDAKRNKTILRLQLLENCLAGYYAAYGNYPPVRLHNSRDIYQKADGHGVQSTGEANENIWGWTKIGEDREQEAWNQVKAACCAQPFGTEYPYSTDDNMQDDVREFLTDVQNNMSSGNFKNYPKSGTKQYAAVMAGFDALKENLGRFSNAKTAYSWREIQIFKFGVMSFLLPRYQLMVRGNPDLYTYFAQWTSNNGSVSNPMTGERLSAQDLIDLNERVERGTATQQDRAKVMNIASDAVCARWLPNLEKICHGTRPDIKFYGVELCDSSGTLFDVSDDEDSSFPSFHVYSPDGDSTSDQYILDSITVLDGWGSEFYYYSPSPHQTYQLWSAGANGRTFPPWISRKELNATQLECVFKWTQDDIRGMSN